jgi:hypothetical protein
MSEHVIELKRLVAEYKFILGDLSPTIHIKLWSEAGGRTISYTQSHHIHTPMQLGPYQTSHLYGDDEQSALNKAIEGLTHYYEVATKEGHEPSDSWLKPNENF